MSRAYDRAIVRPSPKPPTDAVALSSARQKRVKTLRNPSGDRPGPRSRTSTRTPHPPFSATTSTGAPGAYFAALSNHGAHQLGRVEVRDRILLRASLEAREVEQFRHESLQAHRLVRNHAVRLLAVFLGREAPLAQHVRIRDDRRERRVELVRDERHEVRLRKGIQPRLVRGMVKQPHDGDDKKQRDAQEAVARQANDHGVVKRQILRIVEREHFRLADEDAEHLTTNSRAGTSRQGLAEFRGNTQAPSPSPR